MLTRMVVFAGLLLVFSFNGVDSFAAANDKDNPDSPEINIVWDRDAFDRVNLEDYVANGLDIGLNQNSSFGDEILGEDLLDDVNLNAEDNRAYDEQLVNDGVDEFDLYEQSPVNFNSDIE